MSGEDLSEAALEQELEEHLVEQRSSLTALEDALTLDPQNEELLAVHGELCDAIKSAEESLLQLKRIRLLKEIDAVLDARSSEHKLAHEEPNTHSSGTLLGVNSSFLVGSKCRFRHVDGRWYNGQVIELNGDGFARVSFLTPTTEKMQMCDFYMQQRCRFGGSCRMSHGFEVSVEALKQFIPPTWQQLSVGSTVFACSSTGGQGLWRPAELEAWDEFLQRGSVIFVSDGSRLEIGMENLCLSEFAEASDDYETSSEEGESDGGEKSLDYDCASYGTTVPAGMGIQEETLIFANWEKHTRGMASKMMANMGYREGMGLGRTGQGIVTPLQVRVLPKHQSLDFIGEGLHRGEWTGRSNAKKKSRGGKRKRDKKLAEAARAAKAEEDKSPDVFGFINNQLSSQRDSDCEDAGGTRFGREAMQSQKVVKSRAQREDRKSLIAQAEEVAELRNKVGKLEEMALRNRKDKAVYEAVTRKLEESRKALVKAEADHTSVSLAVHSKEKEKKWLRF